ncbi:hypothetical protein AAFG13_26315 [Bradyrhizobium sp. B124]
MPILESLNQHSGTDADEGTAPILLDHLQRASMNTRRAAVMICADKFA